MVIMVLSIKIMLVRINISNSSNLGNLSSTSEIDTRHLVLVATPNLSRGWVTGQETRKYLVSRRFQLFPIVWGNFVCWLQDAHMCQWYFARTISRQYGQMVGRLLKRTKRKIESGTAGLYRHIGHISLLSVSATTHSWCVSLFRGKFPVKQTTQWNGRFGV